ncbi:phosphate/phosphite/phosphonate ABC transporter substrate-binding protein [Aliiglaciecola sp. 3_MG-2023]|uniref:phosphate/phosphite/phosphonate ABC transporter substrate-binding protein n=1 Tax=Aliiglaciecola sp. 3_MG-2023 TaxID=3062644 RepID=UPI0026E2F665|nr:phosphate/phosphite/phosphonate ABC transporter substrate-binding protein [Aliiglaciecola sp. 3_MG-2023]MDO6693200.1 phosphate/phosphite/phosphonate ABC transporter substrate-binding protein [Aliiglaciecola sp. 3_MG-2023]
MYKLALLIGLLFSFSSVVSAQQKTLTFGIVPQQSAKRLAELWTPIFHHISQQSDVNIVFSTAKDIPTFEKRLESGDYDLAYMNPYHYIFYHKMSGYNALAKQSNKTIQGVIVTHADSNIKTIQDLVGSRLAFPAPAAFAATLLPQAELNNLGVEFTPMYVGSHDSVYLNVSRGFFPAGGGIQRTLNNMDEEVQSSLVTIWKSARYTSHAIASHPDVDAATRAKVQAALVNMNNSEHGKVLLKNINFNGFETALNSDWDDVRALNIEALFRNKATGAVN